MCACPFFIQHKPLHRPPPSPDRAAVRCVIVCAVMSACGPPAPQCSDAVADACRPRGASVALAGNGVIEAFDVSEGNVALRAHAQPAAAPDAHPTTLADAQPDVHPDAMPNAVPSTVPDDPSDAVPYAVPDGQPPTTSPPPSPTLHPGAAPERVGSSRLRARPDSPIPRRAASARVRDRPVSPSARHPILRWAYVNVPSGGRMGGRIPSGGGDFNAGPEYEEATRILESIYGMSAEEEAAWDAVDEAAWLAWRRGRAAAWLDGDVS